MPRASISTPFGTLCFVEQDGALTRVSWDAPETDDSTPLLRRALAQMTAYIRGDLTRFDLPLRVFGSPALQAVCAAMCAIPFGDTRTYGDIARDTGLSAQAVGQLCGANPLPVLIPCHRVMGAGGKLTGFSGGTGVETKVALLRHEGAAGLLI